MKYTIAVIIIVAVIGIFISAASAASEINVEPSYLRVSPGDEFTVNITVDPNGAEVYSAQYNLSFDNSLLKALSQTKGSFLSQDGAGTSVVINEIDTASGRVKYGEFITGATPGVTNPGVLATITFEAIAGHGGVSELRFDTVKMSDPLVNPIPTEINDGNVEISSYNFDGFQVTTRTNGTVHGGVFIDSIPGAEDTTTGSFDVPNGDIKWAYLYTGIWGGTNRYEGWVNVIFNGDGTNNNLGPIWLQGQNDTNPNVWVSGCGKHWMYYNVTNLTTAGSTNSATVSKINATDPGEQFDGDPYGIVLVVVYEGGDNPKDLRYWINDGSDGLNYISLNNDGTTNFNGAVDTNKVNDAELTMVHLTAYDPPVSDGLKFNGNTLDTSMVDNNAFELNTWDVTSYLESSGNDAWYTRCGDYPTCSIPVSDGYINICNAILVLDETQSTQSQPDLNVTAITVNPDYDAGHRELFANESNTIIATITNLDVNNSANAFNVSFEIEGVNTWEVRVSGLAAGASTDVTINWTPARGGTLLSPVNYNLDVTADCDGEVSETDETNNASTKTLTVYNNGYKGKRYTGGSDIETEQMETINGSLIYSKGDSAYLTGGSWNSYTVNWASGDISVPGSATVKKARLYVYYNWDSSLAGINASMDFNGHVYSMDDLAAHYKDTKGYGMYYNHKSGTMVYNVTDEFNTAGNTATLTKVVANGIVAIYGMFLVVVYEDSNEPQRLIWINEECDILDAIGSGANPGNIGVNETEATAYAPFTGTIDISRVATATLITVVPAGDSGSGNEDRQYFNSGQWDNVWGGAAGENVSIFEADVKSYLQSNDNGAKIQSRGDYITATNAFLVVEYVEEASPAKLVINEFVSKPGTTQTSEWIELYNPTGGDVSLDGWTLEDNTGSTCGSGTGDTELDGKTVPAKGYLVLNKSEGDFGFALNDGGDIIILKKATVEVDRVAYGDFDDGDTADNAPTPGIDNSTGRSPNGVDTDIDSADFRVFYNPTPGAPNTETGAVPTADSFGVEDASGRSGTYVEVPVNIMNVMYGPVQGIRLRMDYNESVLSLTNISNGDLTSAWTKLQLGEDRRTMVIATDGDAIPDGSSGSVVLLNFSVIGLPGDTSPMNVTLIELSNPDGIVGTAPARNGAFVVSELGSIVGRITYACNGTEIAGATVNLTAGSIVKTTVTNETGYYNFTDVIPGNYAVNASKLRFCDNSTEVTVIAGETTTADMTLWLKGDLNNDGVVADAGDVVLMLRASVGDIPCDMRHDLNGNGIKADAGDVVMIVRASVGDIILW